jgi:hypothetical protein
MARILKFFYDNNIDVIRFGLHSVEKDSFIAGPFHPALSEIANSYLYRDLIEKEISKKVKVVGQIQAPVKEKEVLGEIEYLLDGEVIGSIPIYASECVKEKSYLFSLKHLWKQVKLDT